MTSVSLRRGLAGTLLMLAVVPLQERVWIFEEIDGVCSSVTRVSETSNVSGQVPDPNICLEAHRTLCISQ